MIKIQTGMFNFGFASNMALLLWCICGGFLLHMLESNYLTMLVKPAYEKPVDTAQDVLERGLAVIWSPGIESIKEELEKSPFKITRELAERAYVAKVIFC